MGKCEHDDGVHGYVSLHMKDCPYCRIAELEADNQRLRSELQESERAMRLQAGTMKVMIEAGLKPPQESSDE